MSSVFTNPDNDAQRQAELISRSLEAGTNIYLAEDYFEVEDDHGISSSGVCPAEWRDFFQKNMASRVRGSQTKGSHYTTDFNGARYRCCLANSAKGWGISMRKLPNKIPSLRDDLGLDWAILKDLVGGSGLTLFAGRMGSGKSTTMAACIGKLDTRRHGIATVEDPIEVLYPDRSIIQREVGTHVDSFPEAIRDCVRQNRSTIVISEIRDTETANAALMAASTGHSVLATIHADNAFDIYIRMLALIDERYSRLLARNLRGLWWQQVVRFGIKERAPIPIYESVLVDNEARQVLEKGPDALPMLANVMNNQKRENMAQVALSHVGRSRASRDELGEFIVRRNRLAEI
tara:strand:+ start:805 stop:1845 length:1041 start_codon:yes stop_codon:yes gene_type:complete